MTTEHPPLPTFLIIGAQKSATRWLRSNLGQHPEIFTVGHEVKFFNHPRRVAALGPDWYRKQFAGWDGEPVSGEATPGYLMLRHRPVEVAARIDDALPDVRLLAILRNPVDRAASALVHHQRGERVRPDVGLTDYLRSVDHDHDWLGIVDGGRYAASLNPYLERFGDRLCVLFHDELRSDPPRLYADALDHIGAAAGFVPSTLGEVVRSNTRADEHALSPDERTEASKWFADDVDQLEALLGVDLTRWRH